jgi:hypothetical protein
MSTATLDFTPASKAQLAFELMEEDGWRVNAPWTWREGLIQTTYGNHDGDIVVEAQKGWETLTVVFREDQECELHWTHNGQMKSVRDTFWFVRDLLKDHV